VDEPAFVGREESQVAACDFFGESRTQGLWQALQVGEEKYRTTGFSLDLLTTSV